VLSEQECIVARRYLDQTYGNRGYFIDFANDRALLTALRMLPELVKDEDPTSLKQLTTLTDATDYCIRCEHFLVVISRWAWGSQFVTKWIEDKESILGPDKRAAFAKKPGFPQAQPGPLPAAYLQPWTLCCSCIATLSPRRLGCPP
jgi:hypothetical protein